MRPLLDVTREETAAYCAEHGLAVRVDATNPETARGLIRDEILPLLRRLHPGAEANLRALGDERPRLPRGLEASLVELLASRAGTKAADLGGGVRAVREYDTLRLEGTVAVGAVDARGRAGRSRGAGPAAGGSSGRTPQEGAGSPRGREGAEGGARRPGRWSSAPARSSPCPGSRPRPAGPASSRRGGERGERGRPRGRRDPDRRGLRARSASPRSGPRSRPTTPAATCCSSACSRAPSSSWPT